MVVFTCNHCGDSLQKPRVEKHYSTTCRRYKSLTCVDCLKDFKDEEYAVHTKCMTEDERYAAKGMFTNGDVKKGDLKQESWIDMIKSIVEKEQNIKPSVRNLLNTISSYNNVPRKKPKFVNFLKSSTGGRVNPNDIESAWDLIEKHKNNKSGKSNSVAPQNGNGAEKIDTSENCSEVLKVDKKKKRKDDEEGTTDATKNSSPESKTSKKKKQENSDVPTENDNFVSKTDKTKKRKGDQDNNTNGNDEIEHNGEEPKTYKKKKLTSEEGIAESISDGPKTDKKKKQKNDVDNTKGTTENSNGLKVDNEKKHAIEENIGRENLEETIGNNEAEKFNFENAILDILRSKKEGQISCKKLQRKVLNNYLKETGTEATEKTIKKYKRKLTGLLKCHKVKKIIKLVFLS